MTTTLQVDYSCMADAWSCLRYYYWRYVRHLIPKEKEFAVALAFGEGVHKAREVVAIGGDLDDALKAFDDLYTTAYEHHSCTDDKRTPFNGRALIRAYFGKWGMPDDLHTEVGASVSLEDNVVLIGRIDHVDNDEYCTVADVKTTSSLFWLPQARLNWQLVGYSYMVRELLGIEPKQLCIDALVVPGANKRALKLNPPEHEYALTLYDNLHRRYGSIQPRDYQEWHRWVIHTTRLIRQCMDSDWWPMQAPKACGRYGGGCDYDCLCKAADATQEERLAEALFIIKPWHPFEGE